MSGAVYTERNGGFPLHGVGKVLTQVERQAGMFHRGSADSAIVIGLIDKVPAWFSASVIILLQIVGFQRGPLVVPKRCQGGSAPGIPVIQRYAGRIEMHHREVSSIGSV